MALMSAEQREFQSQVDTISRPLGYWVRQQFEEKGRSAEDVKAQFRRVMSVVGPAREEGKIIIFAPREITLAQIVNAIIGCFEGGYSPWIHRAFPATDVPGTTGDPWYARESFWQDGLRMKMTYDQPTDAEGDGSGEVEVGLPEIISGMEKMAIHAPKHFADLVEENDDAITHDVLMQYVILGDIIYG